MKTKIKLNKGYLIASEPILGVTIVSENVTVFTKNDGNTGYLAEVKQAGHDTTDMLVLDGGLRGALKQAGILNKEGTMLLLREIDIVPTGKKELEEGWVYTYDILG